MTSYKNLAGSVGICSYELGEKTIRIKFHNRKNAIYDNSNNDEAHIETMKRLATQGYGLHGYISENDAELEAFPLD